MTDAVAAAVERANDDRNPRPPDSTFRIWNENKWIPLGSLLTSAGIIYGYQAYGRRFGTPLQTASLVAGSGLFMAYLVAKFKVVDKQAHHKI